MGAKFGAIKSFTLELIRVHEGGKAIKRVEHKAIGLLRSVHGKERGNLIDLGQRSVECIEFIACEIQKLKRVL